MLIFGIHPVSEALRAGRIKEIRVADRDEARWGHAPGSRRAARSGQAARLRSLIATAEQRGVAVRRVTPADLDRAARGGAHQGVIADAHDPTSLSVEELVSRSSGVPLIVVLDGIEDPHNMGAILRTVDAAGAGGVVRQSRHAAPLGGVAAKASAGAVAHVSMAEVVNVARALEELKQLGVWTVGLAPDAPRSYDEIDYRLPTAIVVGAEGSGLRRLVRERCDWIVSIPMRGHVQSLNVSAATAVTLFEAVRQRRRAISAGPTPATEVAPLA